MPISRKRKKKLKKGGGAKLYIDPNKESSITLQDLINVVAVQEFKAGNYEPQEPETPQAGEIYAKVRTSDDTEIAPGVILRADAVVNIPDVVPVNIEDARGNKIGVGTASPIPGDPNHVSITITDPRILELVQGPMGDYSIDTKENDL